VALYHDISMEVRLAARRYWLLLLVWQALQVTYSSLSGTLTVLNFAIPLLQDDSQHR
jgi:hypothetical protein